MALEDTSARGSLLVKNGMPKSGRKDELVQRAADCEGVGARRTWCVSPFGLEAKESAHHIAGHTRAMEECKHQSSEAHIAAVHKSISELDDSEGG